MNLSIVRLEGLAFRGFHGVYPQEQKFGNDFIVDIELHLDISTAAKSDDLGDTVDYAVVYQLVRQVMDRRRNLLEVLVHEVADLILSKTSRVQKVYVTVSKLNPDIGGTCARTSVTLCRVRE